MKAEDLRKYAEDPYGNGEGSRVLGYPQHDPQKYAVTAKTSKKNDST